MKKIPLVTKISCILFLLVAIVAASSVKPLYRHFKARVDSYTTSMCQKVTDLTGLTVSFDSFSPSILSYFSIHGIRLYDNQMKNVVSIQNTKINYKITEIFKGDLNSFIRTVNINGVDIDISLLVEIINSLSKNNQQEQVDFQQLLQFVPSNVNVKNINLIFENEMIASSVFVKQIDIFNSQRKGSVDFQFDCNTKTVLKQNPMTITGNAYLNGSVTSDLEASRVYVSFVDLTNGTYSLNKLNLLASYNNKTVDVRTVQSVNPLAVSCQYNFSENKISASINSENLNPLSIVSVAGKSDITKLLKNVRVSVDVNASTTFDQEFKPQNINYNSKGLVKLPDTIFPGGVSVDYSLAGTDKKIKFSRFSLDGKNIQADGNISFAFKNLQLEGFVDLQKYSLPNNCNLSSEIYIDSLDKGFMLFSPQLFVGDKTLTALQAKFLPREDSFDFELEASDYSQPTAAEPGVLLLNGSYLLKSNFIQSSVSFNRMYVQSVLGIAEQFLDKKTREQFVKVDEFVQPYMFTGDVFLSTNFNSVSYNVPYLVMANTQQENQLLFASVNGNDQTIQLDRFDLIYGKFAVNIAAGLDFVPGSKDMTFYLDAISSSIPYHLQGSISSDSVKLAGDYGTDVEVRFDKDLNIAGTAYVNNFPVVYEQLSVILSADTAFNYSKENGPEFQIVRFELEENDASSAYSPKLIFSGSGTKYGAQLTSITYTDLYSNLEGFADVTINVDETVFDSLGVNIKLKNPTISGEEIGVDVMISNPDQAPLNLDSIMNSLYISALAEINHFSLNRFMAVKNSNNEISATLSLSGTLDHPYALVNVDKLSFLLANEMVNAKGSVMMDDRDVTINNFEVLQSAWKVKDITGNLSLKDMIGSVDAVFETAGSKNIALPLHLVISDSYIPEGKFLPDNMFIKLSSAGLGGTMLKKPLPFEISAIYTPDFISFYSNDELGLVGSFTRQEGLYAQLNASDIISGNVIGIFQNNDLNLSITDIHAKLDKIVDFIAVEDFLTMNSGAIDGYISMNGTYDTPEFDGKLTISGMNLKLPSVFSENVSADKIVITAKENEISIPTTNFSIGKNHIFNFGTQIVLNKWVLNDLNVNFATLPKRALPLKLKTPVISVNGDVECNLLISMENQIMDLSGKISGEKVNIVSNLKDLTALNSSDKTTVAKFDEPRQEFYIRTNVDIFLGTHVMLNLNPLLRCIFAPNTAIKISLDSLNENYEVTGKLDIKSGDIAYVNRNFYIKEGSIKFNPTDITNPQITLRAETREKDEKGQNVRIILSAENQYLLDLTPRFSSIPAKSENQILSLLGQVLIADLNEVNSAAKTGEQAGQVAINLFTSAGDYAFQSIATRKLENALRDSLNFDIFSLRTNVFQSVSKQLLLGENNVPSLYSNLFDVSTVYIGKYLGSAIYVDAMMNLSMDNSANDRDFILHPEIGFEYEVPFLNKNWQFIQDMNASFRFGLAGDWNINESINVIPSLSMSLLWRLN